MFIFSKKNFDKVDMKVKNLNGTKDLSCGCGSWIAHWRNFTKQTATICRAKGCSRNDIVGAHVNKCNSTDTKWYIVPFCKYHNKQGNCIEINNGTDLVPANKNYTCK